MLKIRSANVFRAGLLRESFGPSRKEHVLSSLAKKEYVEDNRARSKDALILIVSYITASRLAINLRRMPIELLHPCRPILLRCSQVPVCEHVWNTCLKTPYSTYKVQDGEDVHCQSPLLGAKQIGYSASDHSITD